MTAFLLTGFHWGLSDALTRRFVAAGVPIVPWSPRRTNAFSELSASLIDNASEDGSYPRALCDSPEPFLTLMANDEAFRKRCERNLRLGLAKAMIAGTFWNFGARRPSGAPINPTSADACWAWTDPLGVFTAPIWARVIPDLHVVFMPEPEDSVVAGFREEFESKLTLLARQSVGQGGADQLPADTPIDGTETQPTRILDVRDLGYDGPRAVFSERFADEGGVRAFLDSASAAAKAIASFEPACTVTLLSAVPAPHEHDELLRSLGLEASSPPAGGNPDARWSDNVEDVSPKDVSPKTDRQHIVESGLFDAAHYLDLNPHLRVADVDPLDHYLGGGFRNSDPHPMFSTRWHLQQYPELEGSDVVPLVHFLCEQPLASPHPLFDSVWFRHKAGAVGHAVGRVPLIDFLSHSGLHWISPHPLLLPHFYLASFPGLRAMRSDVVAHWLAFGRRKMVRPHPIFDTPYYAARMPPGHGGDDPLVHYITSGWRLGLSPHAAFDPLLDMDGADPAAPITVREWIVLLRNLPCSETPISSPADEAELASVGARP